MSKVDLRYDILWSPDSVSHVPTALATYDNWSYTVALVLYTSHLGAYILQCILDHVVIIGDTCGDHWSNNTLWTVTGNSHGPSLPVVISRCWM